MKASVCWFELYEYFSVLHWWFWWRTLEYTSGTCFVGVRMSIQCLASSTDRILQASLMFTSLFSLLCHINISFETYSDTIYWLAVHGSTVLVILKSYVEDVVWIRSDSGSSPWFYRPHQYQICSWFAYFNITIPKNTRFTLDTSIWNMVWVYVLYHISICIWTLEWTSGTCFVGVRIWIQFLASSTDRILQASLIFRYISLVFRYERSRPLYTHRLCPFNVTQQNVVLWRQVCVGLSCTSILVYCIDDFDGELWSTHLVLVLLVLECQFNVWHLPLTAFYRPVLCSHLYFPCFVTLIFRLKPIQTLYIDLQCMVLPSSSY